MGRYLRVYRAFFVSAFARELEFRANFFAKILQNLVWVVFFLLILLVVYGNAPSVAGWSRGEAFVLTAITFILASFSGAFFFSLVEIPEQVRRGTLDFVITKPIDTQFWVSVRRFNFDQLGSLIAGVVVLVVGLREASLSPSAEQWTAFALLSVASLVGFYAFNLALMTTGIWLVRVDNLWVLSDSVTQVARFPLDIYSGPLQRVLTYAVPLAFLATVPARQLVRGVDWPMVGLGLAYALVGLVAARWFWRYALTQYASASS